MNQEQNNTVEKGNNTPLTYTALVLAGAALISFFALYFPMLIFLLVFLAPFVWKTDRESGKPITSAGMIAVTALFVLLSQFNYAVYDILVLSTGLAAPMGYITWKYLKVEKFEEGLVYSILLSVTAGIITAAVVFMLNAREPFALQMVDGFYRWAMASKSAYVSQSIDAMYNYDVLLRSSEGMTLAAYFEMVLGTGDYISTIAKAEKLNALIPYVVSFSNRIAISAIVLFPAFAGFITWWRGNFRFYKDVPVTEEGVSPLKPKPFSTFRIPRWAVTTIAVLMLISFLMQSPDSEEITFNALMMIQDMAYIVLCVQGFAVTEYFLKRSKGFKTGISRAVTMVFAVLISLGFIPFVLGIIDLFIDIRLVYTKAKELKEKTQSSANKNKPDEKKDEETK